MLASSTAEGSFPRQFTASATSQPLAVKIFDFGRTPLSCPTPVTTSGDATFSPNLLCPHSPADPGLEQALSSKGMLPVPRGWSVGIVGLIAFALILSSHLFGLTSTLGILLGVIGAILALGGAWLGWRRRRMVEKISSLWRSGWLRFAPARVGPVELVAQSVHDGHRPEHRDTRSYFSAELEVFPVDGQAPFRFRSAQFSVPADRDGRPVDLSTDGDNGWTIVSYLAGYPEGACVGTGLSEDQIRAGLEWFRRENRI